MEASGNQGDQSGDRGNRRQMAKKRLWNNNVATRRNSKDVGLRPNGEVTWRIYADEDRTVKRFVSTLQLNVPKCLIMSCEKNKNTI